LAPYLVTKLVPTHFEKEDLMDPSTPTPNLLDIVATVGLTLAGFLAQRFVIPFLKIGKRERYARFIATIAVEVIDDLRSRHPDKKWLEHLDEAVAMVAQICGISPEIARRAINAASVRQD
jgi:hypothetical protein